MNGNIIDYITVASGSIVELVNEVRELINYGWQPYGDQYALPEDDKGNTDKFYQPMVKYDD
jgi:hypothetical protein